VAVTEHLMRPGTFTVGLRSTAPAGAVRTILETIDGAGGHIVITPGRIPAGQSDATILGSAVYTGRIEGRPSRGQIEGKGIAAWLGNDDGTTVIETAITKSAASLTTWITDLLVNGITVGTITNTSTYTATFQNVTYREAIDQVCLSTGAEYELRPNFTINAAAPATLFGAPNVVVTRKPEGVDGHYRGIEEEGLVEARAAELARIRTRSVTDRSIESIELSRFQLAVIERRIECPLAVLLLLLHQVHVTCASIKGRPIGQMFEQMPFVVELWIYLIQISPQPIEGGQGPI
jgi:hypothetical protein